MNKPALKRFATEARRELLERVELQARKIGITPDGIQKATVESSDAIFINGRQLKEKEKAQRNKLISCIRDIGFGRVMEEVAYTWFNRFTALRFMEVNDYLPTKVRILSSIIPESTEPDMIKEALTLDLDLDKEYVYELKLNNNDDELFKYLIIKHCNDLNRYMPFMFETIDDYTEILFPEGLLAAESFIRKMTNIQEIPETNWEKIEVIGWLYQYYIAEEKDRVFKAKQKYKAEEIPFATQLFTPDWIVRYMVQNSLGRYWVEANPKHLDLINDWEFYVQNTDENYKDKIAPYINKEINIEDIKCFDPAMGSGHILVYMFDVLYEIYTKTGYTEREIPRLIIENNLYGLDIDDRAYQLACFSVVMKAMEYNKRFLRSIEKEGLTLNLASIQETNSLKQEDLEFIADGNSENLKDIQILIEQFKDAKTIGSLIKLTSSELSNLQKRLESIHATPISNLFEIEKREKALSFLPKLIEQTQIMSLKFDVLVTNPPYMGYGSMNKELADYLKTNYPDSKSDLFAAFMEIDFYLKPNGFNAFINQHSWMFLSSYEKLRKKTIRKKYIENMLHLGSRAFEEIGGEVVQSTTFVLRNASIPNLKSEFLRVLNAKTAQEKKEMTIDAIENTEVPYQYSFEQSNFSLIPGSPIAYWLKNDFINLFPANEKIGNVAETKHGSTIGDNQKFLRFWHEIDLKKNYKWFKCQKGGPFRKWYGNHDYVINWEQNGELIKESGRATIRSENYLFQEGITWSNITTGKSSFRIMEEGFFFESTASVCFPRENRLYMLGLLNTNISGFITQILNPTIHLQAGNVADMPYILLEEKVEEVERIVEKNIELSRFEWDSFENSWDFKKHPFLLYSINKLQEIFELWKAQMSSVYKEIERNELRLNEIFIEGSHLENDSNVLSDVADVSLRLADLKRDVKSFISYAIGCSFGRYSLDEEGLIYTGGYFDSSRYKKNIVVEDNILSINSDSYFEDDILIKLVHFVREVYGEESLEENLAFITEALGRKKNETTRECIRRYLLNDFYKDHSQVYKKRPIYWLFTSGKEKAFNCLIYMHRYDKTTLSRIRTDYLHEVQIRIDSEKKDLLNIIDGDSSTKEISSAKKELKSLDKKIDELRAYDEKLHHMADMQIEIDLDDGVAVNYAKFEGLVAKI